MRSNFVLSLALFTAAASVVAQPAVAQRTRIYSAPAPMAGRALALSRDDEPRAALGISTAGSTSERDTLGLLVSTVMPNSPAEKAGIEEGNRLASINGVNLKVSPADAGDWEVSNAMSRRLTRELNKVRPGDDVELRVYSSGRTRTVTVRTVDSDSLYSRRRFSRSEVDDRPTLGLGLASTNNRRDTLGVLVIFVDESGPAERAGIEEGNRIAAIEGIDLRVSREDAGDDYIANTNVRRLQREISKLRPGDDVDLRVYSEGRVHSMKLRVARAADLPHRRGAFMITGDHMGLLPSLEALPFDIDGAAIGADVRRALEKAMESTGRALEGVGRGLGGARRYYQDDPDERPRVKIEPFEPMQIEPLAPSGGKKTLPSKVPFRSALLVEGSAPTLFAAPMSEASLASDEAPSVTRSGGVSVNIGGLRLVPVGTELAPYLGRGSEEGLLVIDVPAWAHRVLQAGDVVLRVDGCPVRTGSELNEVAVNLPSFRDARLDLIREGERRTVTLPARR